MISPDLLLGGFYDYTQLPAVAKVRLYSGAPDGVTTLGTGCPDARGVVPRIGASFAAYPGLPFAVHLTRVRALTPALVAIGTSATRWQNITLPLDLAFLGMPGCQLLVAPEVVSSTTTTGPAEKGRATLSFTLPNDLSLRGQTFFVQWLLAGSATRALRVAIQ